MINFRRHLVRAKDKKKTLNISKADWITMKALSNKLNVPLIQVHHNAIMIYSGYIYGVDRSRAEQLQRYKNLLAGEIIKCRKEISMYIERFGEIDTEH